MQVDIIQYLDNIYHTIELFSQSTAEQISLACFSQDNYSRYIAFTRDVNQKHCFLSALPWESLLANKKYETHCLDFTKPKSPQGEKKGQLKHSLES